MATDSTSNQNPDYMSTSRRYSGNEPITPAQRESVIMADELPDPLFRFIATLIVISPILFVAAIYYGLINP